MGGAALAARLLQGELAALCVGNQWEEAWQENWELAIGRL